MWRLNHTGKRYFISAAQDFDAEDGRSAMPEAA
jgi:hypothetical protein